MFTGASSRLSGLGHNITRLLSPFLSYPVVSSQIISSVLCGSIKSFQVFQLVCFSVYPNLIGRLFFPYLHSPHIVAKISTLIPLSNSPYLALVSGGSQVYIVLHGEEADEHGVIKMFLGAWWSVRYHWRREKEGRESQLTVRVKVRG